MSGSARIRVSRTRGHWNERGNPYTVIIDGAEAGEVWAERSASLSISPGDHRVRMKAYLYGGSNEMTVSVDEGQTAELVCQHRNAFMSVLNLIVQPSGFLNLHQMTPEEKRVFDHLAEQRKPPAPRNLN